MNEEELSKYEDAIAVTELYANKAFQRVILQRFIDDGIQRYCLTDNVDSSGVVAQLKSRKILHDFLYGILEEAQVLKDEKE